GAWLDGGPGIGGRVHGSEKDPAHHNAHPAQVVQVGDEVEVMILEIDVDRRRISLGMEQCMPNPWEDFAREYKKGDKVKGQIKSITDRSEEHTSELQSRENLVCRLLLEKKK